MKSGSRSIRRVVTCGARLRPRRRGRCASRRCETRTGPQV